MNLASLTTTDGTNILQTKISTNFFPFLQKSFLGWDNPWNQTGFSMYDFVI